MKKSLILGGLLAVLAIGFVSCDKKKENSIAGTYDLASSQYYFDGQKLDYQSQVIGICDSAAVKPVYMYNYDVIWTFNEDGTGDYCTRDNVHNGFNYTLKDNQITLDFGEEEQSSEYKTAITSVFTFENGKIRISDTYSGIHGWAKVDNREEVFGLDGQKNHSLEAVHYYHKLLKE